MFDVWFRHDAVSLVADRAFQYFSKPIWKELLPPVLPPSHQKPYTLLLSIDDLLVTSTWDVSSSIALFSSSSQSIFTQIMSHSANMAGAQQNAPGSTILSRISRNSMRLSYSQRNTTMYGPFLLLNTPY